MTVVNDDKSVVSTATKTPYLRRRNQLALDAVHAYHSKTTNVRPNYQSIFEIINWNKLLFILNSLKLISQRVIVSGNEAQTSFLMFVFYTSLTLL